MTDLIIQLMRLANLVLIAYYEAEADGDEDAVNDLTHWVAMACANLETATMEDPE